MDTLATALYATTDDMLKEHPDLAPWRPPVGITPRLSDAELVTLATMQAILGYTSEATWLRHARAHLRPPLLLPAPAARLSKRLRKAAGLMRAVNRILAATTRCGATTYGPWTPPLTSWKPNAGFCESAPTLQFLLKQFQRDCQDRLTALVQLVSRRRLRSRTVMSTELYHPHNYVGRTIVARLVDDGAEGR